MKYFEFFNPVKICAGEDAILHLNYELQSLCVKKPLLLSDEGLKKLGLVDKVIKISKLENYVLYTNIPTDSGVEVVNNILKFLQENNCDGIVALGGGSVIDTAKGVKMAYARTSDLKQIMGLEVISKAKELPFIVMPTTAGTGSEVTNVAVIRDEKTDVKMEFITPYLMPNVAIIDPTLTLTLPPKISASTGFDALCHAIEGFSCMQKNPISDAYALTSIKLIYDNLLTVCKEPNNKEARLNMAIASTLAGLCFGNSMVGGVHAIGHSLGGVCHIAHGDAMTILLPHVMEFNKEKLCSIYAQLFDIFCQCNEGVKDEKEKCECVIQAIKGFRQELNILTGLPINLTDTKRYDKTLIDEIVQGALNDGAMIVNPVGMTIQDIKNILQRAE
ncbi:MAG: iron-containing alcohol dehydrogenase [Clostridiales bacterium]|nr:iron-containing alcohol dehydrogenase [Clostridiales bacterium]